MTKQHNKPIHISLWITQSLLGAVFFMAGVMKVSQPIEQLSQMVPWSKDVAEMLVRFIGTCELLGVLGLILPSLLRIKPVLTPIAASCLALIQTFAIIFHISRGETSVIGMNLILLSIALFIAWGRFRKAPIQSKA